MSRFGNLISRAIEREQEKQPEILAKDTPIHSTDGQSARILQMPNRRVQPSKPLEVESSNETQEEAVNRENWKWSEAPQFGGKLLGNGTAKPNLTTEKGRTLEPLSDTLSAVVEATPAPFSRAVTTPVFRSVEVNPERVEPHLVAITQPRSVHCEELRNLRTRILHAAQRRTLQAITIASGSPSEGKSTVALNLAWLMAQTDGMNALIIDSDLRLPCLADYLDVETHPGLSEVFSGTAKLEDAIIKLEPSGLHLLPGGAARDDVAEMLSGNKFRTVLEQTRKMFDFIIVDAPSLGIFTDAAVLINQTDAALLVVRSGKTRFGLTNRLLDTLPRERLLGVVLNGSDEGLANESHYDSYYYQNRRRIEGKDSE